MNADNIPNQISYNEVCTISGKLYIESQYEITRLHSILSELQKKLGNEQQARIKVEAELAEAKKEITVLKKVNGNGNSS